MLFYMASLRNQIKKLQGVHNSTARLVTHTRKYDHIKAVLVELQVGKRIVFKILLLIFKCLHGLAPSYLSDLIVKIPISWPSF